MTNPRPISSLLNPCEELLKHSKLLQRLQRQLDQLTGTELTGHYLIQNLRNGILVLQADTPAWATRLRYILPSLQKQLRESGAFGPLRGIQIVVVPQSSHTATPSRRAKLSASAANILRDAADTTDDPKLRNALHRLAENGKGDTSD